MIERTKNIQCATLYIKIPSSDLNKKLALSIESISYLPTKLRHTLNLKAGWFYILN